RHGRRAPSRLRAWLALDARAYACHESFHLGKSCHGGVAGSGHGECAMRGTVLDGLAKGFARHDCVRNPRREAVATAYAIHDLKLLAHGRLDDARGLRPAQRTPVVAGG